jgi:alcohol dehydrogenase
MAEVGALRVPPTVLIGNGLVSMLGRVAAPLGRRVLLCTDELLASGEQGRRALAALRDGAGLDVDVLDAAVPELPRRSVEAAIAVAQRHAPDCVVGLGGGSAIDLAKLVALGLSVDVPLDQFYGEGHVPGPTVPVIAVPTTAGTGSEVTPVAVLSDPEIELKVGISSPHLIPRAAVCDAELTRGAPPQLTAHAGIDALAHAIESYTAARGTPPEDLVARVFVGGNVLTDRFALHAVSKLASSLRGAQEDDPAARADALEGSLCAGLAFGTAGTAGAHALQYPLGARTNTPHGLGVGLLLPFVMAYNRPACEPRLADVAEAMGLERNAGAAVDGVRALAIDLGLPASLRELGLERSELAGLAAQAVGIDRLARNNPRTLDLAGAGAILDAAWRGQVEDLQEHYE